MDQVFIPEEDRVCDAEEFLSWDEKPLFELRRQLRPKTEERTLLCPICFQPLIIAGTKKQKIHFRHFTYSEICPIKTGCKLTPEQILAMKFNGQKEGLAHKTNKIFIHDTLKKDISFEDVKMEKTFREENTSGVAKEWRRPDVSAFYTTDKVKIVFELQVSTTFIDVIIDREKFYKERNAYIAWVFLNFEGKRFTELDIAYANKSNALVLDDECRALCQQHNELYFRCYYRKPYITDGALIIEYEWESEIVSIKKLIFDDVNLKLFYFDTDKAELQLLDEIVRKKEIIHQEQEEQKKKAEEERNKPLFSYKRSQPSSNGLTGTYSQYKRSSEERKSTSTRVNIKNKISMCSGCNQYSNTYQVGKFHICKKCGHTTK
jgi:hypothetical protein